MGTRGGEGRGPSQTQSLTGTACEPPALGLVGSVASASVGAGAGAPATGYQLAISSAPEILKPTRGLWETSSEESTAADGSDGGGGDRGEAGAAEETELEALRSELTGIYHSLPEAAFDPFWGSDSRQVHTCASPPLIPLRQSQHLSAALICARPIPRPPFRVNSLWPYRCLMLPRRCLDPRALSPCPLDPSNTPLIPPSQAQWVELVSSASRPAELSAATTLLEVMVSDRCLKPHWRFWALPSQDPLRIGTWAGCWYR
jgi:hypothetical protein